MKFTANNVEVTYPDPDENIGMQILGFDPGRLEAVHGPKVVEFSIPYQMSWNTPAWGELFNRQCEILSELETTRWEFPQDKFVEYDESDEWWCRALGIGREVTRVIAFRTNAAITGIESRDGETVLNLKTIPTE